MGFLGAETNYIMEFTVELLQSFGAVVGDADALRSCGDALMGMLTMLRERPRGTFPPAEVEQFVGYTKVALRHFRRFGISRPKVHQLAHIAHFCITHGSPANWGCWSEEGCNRWLARIANRSHRAVWHDRTLSEFSQAYGLGAASSSRSTRRRTR